MKNIVILISTLLEIFENNSFDITAKKTFSQLISSQLQKLPQAKGVKTIGNAIIKLANNNNFNEKNVNNFINKYGKLFKKQETEREKYKNLQKTVNLLKNKANRNITKLNDIFITPVAINDLKNAGKLIGNLTISQKFKILNRRLKKLSRYNFKFSKKIDWKPLLNVQKRWTYYQQTFSNYQGWQSRGYGTEFLQIIRDIENSVTSSLKRNGELPKTFERRANTKINRLIRDFIDDQHYKINTNKFIRDVTKFINDENDGY